MTEQECKNERLKIINPLSVNLGKATNNLKEILGDNANIPDLGSIIKNKVFELEDYFHDKGKNFYKDNMIEKVFFEYLFINAKEGIIIIDKMLKKLEYALPTFGIKRKSFIANVIANKELKKYQVLCNKMDTFSIDKDIEDALILVFTNNNYVPGVYTKSLEEVKKVLNSINMSDVSDKLEKDLKEFVAQKETESLDMINYISSTNDIKHR